MTAQDVGVVLSAAWLMGAYSTALVAAFHLVGRQPHPRPVQAVQSLRLMPPEEMLAAFNRRLDAARLEGDMVRPYIASKKETN